MQGNVQVYNVRIPALFPDPLGIRDFGWAQIGFDRGEQAVFAAAAWARALLRGNLIFCLLPFSGVPPNPN